MCVIIMQKNNFGLEARPEVWPMINFAPDFAPGLLVLDFSGHHLRLEPSMLVLNPHSNALQEIHSLLAPPLSVESRDPQPPFPGTPSAELVVGSRVKTFEVLQPMVGTG